MQTCSICLNEPHQPTTVLPCGHQFCHACITHWQERKNECPNCRGTIRKLKQVVEKCRMQTCSICLNEPRQPKTVQPCGHQFCRACITRWQERKNVCPYCKGNMKNFKPPVEDFQDERKELSFKFVLLIAFLAIVRLMGEFLPACWWNDLGDYGQYLMRGIYPPTVRSRWV